MPVLTPSAIAEALHAPLLHVEAFWPLLLAALAEQGIASDLVEVATAATIMVETGSFQPINEEGGPDYFTRLYEHRADLGNVRPGDGALFHGRGFVQITGRDNYRVFGQKLGLDLENNPDLALDPTVASRVLALFFRTHGVAAHAGLQDWRGVRHSVNGGFNGWDLFNHYVLQLLPLIETA